MAQFDPATLFNGLYNKLKNKEVTISVGIVRIIYSVPHICQQVMPRDELTIRAIGRARVSGQVWTCHLSCDEAKINAEYRICSDTCAVGGVTGNGADPCRVAFKIRLFRWTEGLFPTAGSSDRRNYYFRYIDSQSVSVLYAV